jgi:outer membrane translocation and assembly module TamA
MRVLRIAPSVFVDVARAYDAPPFADSRAHVDVGVGLRVAVPGAGVLRADVARGLRDGEMALSFGWTR